MEDNKSVRPSLVLRLGVTGARNLRAVQIARIQAQLGDVFGLVKAEMERLAAMKEVAGSYACNAGGEVQPRTVLITPLALGADRLGAEAALDQGCEIFAPMPFPQEEYEKDFTGNRGKADAKPMSAEQDLGEFRQLLSRGSGWLELDGARSYGPDDDHSAGRAYEAVGRFVVRHCDVLVAVWDGRPSNGRGGTAEVVHYAATTGVPIWWINALKETDPVWLADIHDILDPVAPAPEELSAEAKLQTYLRRLISPPPIVSRHKGFWDWAASLLEEKEISPLDAYYTEAPLSDWFLWKTYSVAMKWFGGNGVDESAPPIPIAAAPAPNKVAAYWFDKYALADGFANGFADRYRSGYLLTILSTMTVVACGATALGLGFWHPRFELGSHVTGGLEFGSLLLIVALILLSIHYEWHRKSIEYRLLAELFRKEETLAPLGWALPVEKVQQLADSEPLSWIGWLFAAAQRSGPLPEGRVAGAETGRGILLHLLDEQLAYHRRREKKALKASHRFELMGTLTFGAVLLCVLIKLGAERGEHSGVAIFLGVIATVLAGVSAAFVTIRGYAELELLAEQSHHMVRELHLARLRVLRLDVNRALVSQDLGSQAANVATLMLQDLDGWGRLFRGKQMDAT
jgi:hypothetical protein